MLNEGVVTRGQRRHVAVKVVRQGKGLAALTAEPRRRSNLLLGIIVKDDTTFPTFIFLGTLGAAHHRQGIPAERPGVCGRVWACGTHPTKTEYGQAHSTCLSRRGHVEPVTHDPLTFSRPHARCRCREYPHPSCIIHGNG
nr:uncharacterized protein LOC113828797 [Penaeus vannamei]